LQDGVELREKLSAKLGFFGLGFCRSGASSFFRCAGVSGFGFGSAFLFERGLLIG